MNATPVIFGKNPVIINRKFAFYRILGVSMGISMTV